MRLSLLYNPFDLITRLSDEIKRKRRLKKLKKTPASSLSLGEIDSLELIEIIARENEDEPIIFDIGANIGTWTLLVKAILPNSKIYAFEPLEKHIQQLRKNTAHMDELYIQQYCVGNEDKIATLNVASFSDSSSLLSATSLEYETYQITKETEVQVEVKKLSDMINSQALPIPNIIKLDIQGFELEALKGLEEYLSKVKYIICEVSFKEYYKDQPLFNDILSYLAKFNIHLFAFGNNTPIGIELNQIDVLFKNKSL